MMAQESFERLTKPKCLYIINGDNIITKRDNMRLELNIVNLLNKGNFTIREISKALNEHYSLVHRIVNRLSKENILIKKQIGKAFVCSLNYDNEKTNALLSLSEIEKKEGFYLKNREIKLILQDFVNTLKKEFKENIKLIILFGSFAKNKATKNSDIDIFLLVKYKIPVDKTIKNFYAKYGKEINVIMLTLKELKQQKDKELINEVRANHIILYGTNEFAERFK